jgi:CheY-like chemotaxis protein
MSTIDPNARLNLSKAVVLLVDGSQHSLDVTTQMFRGFGVSESFAYSAIDDADRILQKRRIDLIVIDPSLEGGYEFLHRLRHSNAQNAYVPVILLSGHVRARDVAKARDCGVNFVVAKPVSATVLLQRVQWVAKDPRPFVEVNSYIGPDRRFKSIGPPPGSDGRRDTDLSGDVGEATEPNLSEDEISAMFKPQRVAP